MNAIENKQPPARVSNTAPRSPARRGLIVALSALMLGGCLQQLRGLLPTDQKPDTVAGNAPASKQGEKREEPTFAQFTDIPIPAGATIDFDKLLVLGTEEGWIGRLPMDVQHSMTDMYSFYEREMPRFGWEKVTVVRASVSTMTYQRSGRISTITLQDKLAGGATVDFTVAPAARIGSGPQTFRATQPRSQ